MIREIGSTGLIPYYLSKEMCLLWGEGTSPQGDRPNTEQSFPPRACLATPVQLSRLPVTFLGGCAANVLCKEAAAGEMLPKGRQGRSWG